MEFGRIENFDEVDYKLPPLGRPTTALKHILKKTQKTRVYIGCPVWTHPGFKAKIYPKDCRSADFFKYYAESFNTVELNSSHYAIPSKQQLEKWRENCSSDFKFCPKVPKQISHAPYLTNKHEVYYQFIDFCYQLKHNCGPVFLQLPPQFGPKNLGSLLRFIGQFPKDIELALELRNPEWFSNILLLNKLLSFLESEQRSLLITDTSGRRDILHSYLTTNFCFIRFTANSLHPTDFTRLNDWAERIHAWSKMGIESIYFFMHQPDESECVELSEYLIQKLELINPEIMTRPIFRVKAEQEKQQMSLF